jgi:predicted esterase
MKRVPLEIAALACAVCAAGWLVSPAHAAHPMPRPAAAQGGSASSSAQTGEDPSKANDEYAREFRRGVELLTARKLDEGLAAMRRCAQLRPTDPRPVYNIACGHALKGEVDAGLEHLQRAVDLGIVFVEADGLNMLASADSDLAALRTDERFAALVEHCKAQIAKVEAYAATPLVYVPAALESAERVPLLVVVHDHGDTKEGAFAKGPWKQLADELGYALVIPSGRAPLHFGPEVAPEKGMTWFRRVEDYEKEHWKYDAAIEQAVAGVRKQRKLDPERVHIVGVGLGAMLAFNVALTSPGLYKGVVAHNGALNFRIVGPRLDNARKLGLRTQLLMPREPRGMFANTSVEDYERLVVQMQAALANTKLAGGLERCAAPNAEAPVDGAALRAALAALAARPSPAAPRTDGQ